MDVERITNWKHLPPTAEREARYRIAQAGLNQLAIGPRMLRKLVRVAMGRSWGGDPMRWPEVVEGAAALYVEHCEKAGEMPKEDEFCQMRKEWCRAYALQEGLNRYGLQWQGLAKQ